MRPTNRGALMFEIARHMTEMADEIALAECLDNGKTLAGGKKLLHGKFGRGVKVALCACAVRTDQFGRKPMQMGLVTRRDLQNRRINGDKAKILEIATQFRDDPVSR